MRASPTHRRAAVLGSPIAHSRSPQLHLAAYRALGLTDWTYDRIECTADQLPGLVGGFGPEWVGLSVTMPGKFAALAFAGLADRFIGKVFSASMVSRGKPAPDLFLHVAKVMGVEPRDCLVIEDSPAGVEAARRANMAVIGFVGGSHADSLSLRATLTALGPDAICSGFDEVLDLVAG